MNTPTPAQLCAFLGGTDEIDGIGFGDRHPTISGAYWWRKHLHVFDALALAQPALAAPVLGVSDEQWRTSKYGKEAAKFADDYIELSRKYSDLLAAQQPTPAASPAMRTVSEEEALQGGRWVSSDDVQRMTQQIHRATYPDVAPPVNCLLCDIVAEVCARLESQVMQPVQPTPLTDLAIPHLGATGKKRYDVDLDMWVAESCRQDEFNFARAIEAAHGISAPVVPTLKKEQS